MEIKEYQEKISQLEKNETWTRRQNVINSSLLFLEKSGKFSGNLKNILFSDDLDFMKDKMGDLKVNISDMFYQLTALCNSMDISLEEILTDIENSKE